MKENLFFSTFNKLIRSPALILCSVILLLIILFLSNLFNVVALNITSNTLIMITAVIFSIVGISIIGFFFAGMVGLAKKSDKKSDLPIFFRYGSKYWLRNFSALILQLFLINIITWASYWGAFGIGTLLNLNVNLARIVYILIYFIGLIGLLIFFTPLNFCIVLYDKTLMQSIKISFNFVRKDYILTLLFLLSLFIINWAILLISYHNQLIADLIFAVFILPFICLLVSEYLLSHHDIRAR